MGITDFKIIFNQSGSTFYPGQPVAGIVTLRVNKSKTIHGLKLRLVGRADCEWETTEEKKDMDGKIVQESVTQSKTEHYFNRKIILVAESQLLEPGKQYEYAFSFTLPHNIPSSFRSSYGNIAYFAEAKVNVPWTLINPSVKVFFTVKNLLDINDFPHLKNPIKKEKYKTFCFVCCTNGPLTIVVYMPKTGFSKNEAITVTVEVDNRSGVKIYDIRANILKKIEWKANFDSKSDTKKLISPQSLGFVEAHKNKTLIENLQIPRDMDFPNIRNCSIISMDYEIQVVGHAEGMHLNLDIHIPIVIGDIPFAETGIQYDTDYPKFDIPVYLPYSNPPPYSPPYTVAPDSNAPSGDRPSVFHITKGLDSTPRPPSYLGLIVPSAPPPSYDTFPDNKKY